MVVPQAMAYAMLAGMPPIYGLYGALIPLCLYALLGTSHAMSIGPVAISALLIFAGISQIAEPRSPEYISLVILTGLLIGVVQVLASFIRLGFLVNFLSHPVIAGFTSAAAIIIAVSQLKYVLGIMVPSSSSLVDTLTYILQHLQETHWPTLLLCLSGMALILTLKKLNRKLPGALIAVSLAIVVVAMLGLDQQGIKIVKEVPEGLPAFLLPAWTWEDIQLVLPTVFTVTVIGIVESISIAKVWEAKFNATQSAENRYKIDANQEFLALGIAKIGGACFQAIPTSGSFTRSAVNHESGAQTQVSSLITFMLVALTLLFLTPLFYSLPEAILAAIILLSVRSLFEYKEAIHLWKTHRNDFYIMILTFLITLIAGIEEGILAGILFSVIMIIYDNAKPHIAILGQLPYTQHYKDIERFPEAVQIPHCAIIRLNGQLFFANALFFKDFIEPLLAEEAEPLKALVLDASCIHDIDSSGLNTLEEMLDYLDSKGIQFYLASPLGLVRERLRKAHLMEKIGEAHWYMTVHEAVEAFLYRAAPEPRQQRVKVWEEQ